MSTPELKVGAEAEKPTPTQELLAQASREHVVSDARGRKITLSKPNVLAQYRLVDMIGDKRSSNQVYMSMTAPLLYVVAIDGQPVAGPQTLAELEALIMRLDEEGIAAVMAGVNENWGAVDPEADKTALKK